MRRSLSTVITVVLWILPCTQGHAAPARQPNIIFILTDDLGLGDVGVFFQNARRMANNRAEPWHLTPQLDRMATEGAQLRHHYCPAPVCAPSRASLLLGVHQGHANVRDNQFDKALENNHTLATVLKSAGYATACIGKWGLQGSNNAAPPHRWPAHPLRRGFDSYFGYISHKAGHGHYPKEDGQALIDGEADVAANYDRCYTTDLFTARAKKWITEQHAAKPRRPFFLYLAYDTPHAKLQLPPGPFPTGRGTKGGVQWLGTPGRMINTADATPDTFTHPDYATATWDHDRDRATPEQPGPDVYKRYASGVRRIDECVGDLLALLKDLGLDANTLVVFTSDNGPSKESYLKENYEPTFFRSFGPHDGIKRDLWEGGIRVGALARWPDKIPRGRVSNEPSQFHDWLPTFAEIAGVPAPARTDGVSLVPTLTGKGAQSPSRVYVEYSEGGKTPAYADFAENHRGRIRRQMQALRIGDFMGVRYQTTSHAVPFEIYNVVTDPQQTNNLAPQPAFAALQRQMRDTVLRVRRPSAQAKRPYDDELVPSVSATNAVSGIKWRVFDQKLPWVAMLDDLKPTSSGTRTDLVLDRSKAADSVLFAGYIEAPTDGEYTFHLRVSSGALLRLHEATVIDADFGHTDGSEVSGAIRLQAGRHPFRLYYHRGSPTSPEIKLQWSSATLAKQELPASALFHDPSPVHGGTPKK
jgi:arylsulfatase A-like enzyme